MRLCVIGSALAVLAAAGCSDEPDAPPPAGISVSGDQDGDRLTCTASIGVGEVPYSAGDSLGLALAGGGAASFIRVGAGGGGPYGPWRGPQVASDPFAVRINVQLDPDRIAVNALCTEGGRSANAAAVSRIEVGATTIKLLDDDEETVAF